MLSKFDLNEEMTLHEQVNWCKFQVYASYLPNEQILLCSAPLECNLYFFFFFLATVYSKQPNLGI